MKALLLRIGKALLTAFFVTLIVTLVVKIAFPDYHYTEFLAHLFSGRLKLKEIAERAPSTARLIFGSYLIALLASYIVVFASARLSKWIAVTLSQILRSVPFFAVATLSIMVYAFDGAEKWPGWIRSYFVYPGAFLTYALIALALYQMPSIVALLVERPPHLIRELARAFLNRLPETIAASILADSIFGQPGEGRLVLQYPGGGIIGVVTTSALVVLLLRFLFDPATKQANPEVSR